MFSNLIAGDAAQELFGFGLLGASLLAAGVLYNVLSWGTAVLETGAVGMLLATQLLSAIGIDAEAGSQPGTTLIVPRMKLWRVQK